MEPKALEGIWACASSSDPGRRRGPMAKSSRSFFPPHLSRRDLAGIREARSGLADPLDPGQATEKGFMKWFILSLSLK